MIDQFRILAPLPAFSLEAMVLAAPHIDLMDALAAAGNSDIARARLARPIDDASDDRDGDRLTDMLQARLRLAHDADHIETLARARRTGDDIHAARTQLQGLQNGESHPHLFDGVGGQGDAQSIADTLQQQGSQADRRLDAARHLPSRLCDSQVQGMIASVRQKSIGGDRQTHIRGFHADFEGIEIAIFQQTALRQGTLDHRLRTGFSVFF